MYVLDFKLINTVLFFVIILSFFSKIIVILNCFYLLSVNLITTRLTLQAHAIGELIRFPKMGRTIHKAVHQLPRLELQGHVQVQRKAKALPPIAYLRSRFVRILSVGYYYYYF